jgi:hypothetical protein
MLCRQDRESDRIRKHSFALISTIFNANNIARASAEKIDELSGSRLIERRAPDMAADATAVSTFEFVDE